MLKANTRLSKHNEPSSKHTCDKRACTVGMRQITMAGNFVACTSTSTHMQATVRKHRSIRVTSLQMLLQQKTAATWCPPSIVPRALFRTRHNPLTCTIFNVLRLAGAAQDQLEQPERGASLHALANGCRTRSWPSLPMEYRRIFACHQ